MSEYSLREYLGTEINSVRSRCGIGCISLRERLSRFYNLCSCKPELGGNYAKIVSSMQGPGLVGLVDMHTHLASNLAFGTELFYGAADGNPEQFYNNCNQLHGGWGIDNPNGNIIRNTIVNLIQGFMGRPDWNHRREGWPSFPAWPTYHDRLHQQMRVEWLERAWRGGLRVIVTLSINSHLLADAAQCKGPCDDRSSGDIQIAEIKRIAAGQEFMEIVYSPEELREVVQRGHLAVIIGSELDCMGNFYKHAGYQKNEPSEQEIVSEIKRLYGLGVRYFFPIHLLDNMFGGTAVNDFLFDLANCYQSGKWYEVENAPQSSQINYEHILNGNGLIDEIIKILNIIPNVNVNPAVPYGHRNKRGLQYLGRVAIREMMKLGVMIDIDHMGEKTIRRDNRYTDNQSPDNRKCPDCQQSDTEPKCYDCSFDAGVLDISEQYKYPICAGHCGFREGTARSERSHQEKTIQRLIKLNGMFGIGITEGIPTIADNLEKAKKIRSNGGFALGSDCNGLEKTPAPLPPKKAIYEISDANKRKDAGMIVYKDNIGAATDALTKCTVIDKKGNRTRTWDYSIEGFVHIGMYPDMIEEMWSHGHYKAREGEPELIPQIDDHIKTFFSAAERLAVTWEICEARKNSIV